MPDRQRILRLFNTVTTLDIPLVSAALEMPSNEVAAQLGTLAREGKVVRLHRAHPRRSRVRVQFEVAA